MIRGGYGIFWIPNYVSFGLNPDNDVINLATTPFHAHLRSRTYAKCYSRREQLHFISVPGSSPGTLDRLHVRAPLARAEFCHRQAEAETSRTSSPRTALRPWLHTPIRSPAMWSNIISIFNVSCLQVSLRMSRTRVRTEFIYSSTRLTSTKSQTDSLRKRPRKLPPDRPQRLINNFARTNPNPIVSPDPSLQGKTVPLGTA